MKNSERTKVPGSSLLGAYLALGGGAVGSMHSFLVGYVLSASPDVYEVLGAALKLALGIMVYNGIRRGNGLIFWFSAVLLIPYWILAAVIALSVLTVGGGTYYLQNLVVFELLEVLWFVMFSCCILWPTSLKWFWNNGATELKSNVV